MSAVVEPYIYTEADRSDDMIEQAIWRWNPWWAEKKVPDELTGIRRDITETIIKTLKTRYIKDVIGVRRSGKTTVLYQVADHLIKSGIHPKNIMLLNFDDPAINATPLDTILTDIYKLNPDISHLFLDEIQQKKGWEQWVRMLYDTKRFDCIFLSGSSASLLSYDIGRVLTGRHITFKVMPLSFAEYLRMRGFENIKPDYLIYNREKLLHYLTAYLEEGGFPESTGLDEFNHKKILTALYNDIIARDVASRFGASSDITGRICQFMLTNTTGEYSFNSIAKNSSVTVETAEKYIGYLKESLLIMDLPLFSYKLKSQFKQNKKTYAIDTGLRNEVSFRFSLDIGKLAENAVFLELNRRYDEIYYWKDKGGFEVDFVVKNGQNIQTLIQVCWNADNEKTRKREENSLIRACKEFKLKSGMILTEDLCETVLREGHTIEYYPLWRWLCRI